MMNIIKSYLEDRSVILDKRTQITTYAGIPEGSILEPLLWNSVYDGVLRLVLPEHNNFYADDLGNQTVDEREILQNYRRWQSS